MQHVNQQDLDAICKTPSITYNMHKSKHHMQYVKNLDDLQNEESTDEYRRDILHIVSRFDLSYLTCHILYFLPVECRHDVFTYCI